MANLGPVVLPKPAVHRPEQHALKPVPIVSKTPVTRTLGTRTVRFARNKATLGHKGRSDITAVIAEAKRATKVELRVRPFYTKRPASVRLADARAETVRAELIKGGINESSITVHSQGATNPLVAEVTLHALDQQAGEIFQSERVLATEAGDIDDAQILTTSF